MAIISALVVICFSVHAQFFTVDTEAPTLFSGGVSLFTGCGSLLIKKLERDDWCLGFPSCEMFDTPVSCLCFDPFACCFKDPNPMWSTEISALQNEHAAV